MDNYFIPTKSVFKNKFVNVLDIESRLEFLADDILSILNINNIANTQFIDLTENLSTTRTVLIDGNLCKKQTLNWLALKNSFKKFNYEGQNEFTHWIRKSLKPALALKKEDDFYNKDVLGINTLSWYFTDNDKSVDSLVSVYQSNLVDFIYASSVTNNLQEFKKGSVFYNRLCCLHYLY